MELTITSIIAAFAFLTGIVSANILPITISGNVSVYPGEDVSFICILVEPDVLNVVFQWTRQTNMSMMLAEDADEENSTSAGGGGDIVHNSTLSILNVNYTDNGEGYYCNSPNCSVANCTQSSISYLTVLSPVIVSITTSPVLLQFGNMTTLNCSAMGGPRLELAWHRNGVDVALEIMGDQTVIRTTLLAGNDDIRDYTCRATIDSMQDEETVTVIVAPYNVMISDSDRATIVTNSTTVNNGDSLVLNCTADGGPANMYRWFKDNMLFDNDSVVNITSVEATDGGLYECRVSNDAGNSTASVTINVAPRFVVMPQDTEVLVGTQLMLSCSADGFPVPTISWLYNDMIITDGITSDMNTTVSSSTLSLSSVQLNNTGDYVCQMTSTVVTMSLNSIATVNAVLNNIVGLMNMSSFPGEDVTWMCSVQSTTDLTITWYINGTMVSSEMGTASHQTISNVYTLNNINYTDSNSVVMCRAAGNSVTVDSDTVALTVQVPVIASIIPSSPVLLQSGDSVNLTCSAVGGPRLVLVWQRDGMDIEIGDSMVTHTIASASNNDLGQYTCQAFIDSELMESTVLVVVAPHNVMIADSNALAVTNPTTVNNGDSLALNCTADGGPANMHRWFKDNMLFDNDSVVNITSVEATDGGLYECRVSNDAGNSTASVTINASDGPLDVTVQSVGGTTILITWTEPTLVGKAVMYYKVYYTPAGQGPTLSTNSTTTSITLSDLVPGVEYSINVTAITTTGGRIASTTITAITITTALFQIRLRPIGNCLEWIVDRPSQKLDDIRSAVMEVIAPRCSCAFNTVDETFSCRGSQGEFENTVVFRARITIQGPIADDIVDNITNWVQSSPSISVVGVTLAIDPNCPAMLDSFNSADCVIVIEQPTPSPSISLPHSSSPSISPSNDSTSSTTGIIVGVVMGVVCILILVINAVVLLVMYQRRKESYRTKKQPENRHDCVSPTPGAYVRVNALPPVNKPVTMDKTPTHQSTVLANKTTVNHPPKYENISLQQASTNKEYATTRKNPAFAETRFNKVHDYVNV